MKTTEISPHKTGCLNRFKKELEDGISGGY